MKTNDDTVFLAGERRLLDLGIEMVVPALAALLALPAPEQPRQKRPVTRHVRFHELAQLVVFLFGPRALIDHMFAVLVIVIHTGAAFHGVKIILL